VQNETLGGLATAVLRDCAPDQLGDFPIVLRGFDASPRGHERAQRGVREESASGAALAGEVIGSIVLAVGADLLKDLLVDGAKQAGRKLMRLRRRPRVTSSTVLPELDASRMDQVRLRAAALLCEYGLPAEEAQAMADSFVQQWPAKR
jgi:hypothetical protein